ncbi:glycosyltransferase [Vibrio owensii]|nr:glycosyltransferase [Vibrio owensii]
MIFYLAWVDDYLRYIPNKDGFFALFSDVLGASRLVPREDLPQNLGFSVMLAHTTTDNTIGPNARFNVFGLHYFGVAGLFVYSLVLGIIVGLLRNKLRYKLPFTLSGLMLYTLFAYIALYVEQDFNSMAMKYFLNFAVFCILIFPFTYLISRYRKKTMSSIAVLMSTYNGQKFLKQQVDSILNQKNVDITLFIRDDGSSDNTKELLTEYAERFSNINLIFGENIGVAKSFISLAHYVYEKYPRFDVYTFCDQDDFWLQSKCDSVSKIMVKSSPCLVVSRFFTSDENLSILRHSTLPSDFKLGNLLVEGQIPGCAMNFNYSLLEMYISVVSTEEGKQTFIHDYLLLIVASLKGSIMVTSSEEMHYRQHDFNVIGANRGGWSKFSRYLKYIKTTQKNRTFVDESIMLCRILDGASDSKEIHFSIKAGGTFVQRLNCARQNVLFKRSALSNFIFKFMIIIGLYKQHGK